MNTRHVTLALLATLAACGQPTTPPPATTASVDAPVVEKPRKEGQNMVLDVAIGSPDHTTLVAAVKAAGLANALGSPGGVYTVFAPTNDAFAKLPAGTVESLLLPENKATLKAIIQHHAMVPIMQKADLKDGQVLSMSDGTKVTVHIHGDEIKVDDAKILGEVSAVNGIVYVVDTVILPPKG